MADKTVHYLAAHWTTMCGRVVNGPIEPVDVGIVDPESHRQTIGRAGSLVVTWVPFDATCRVCRGWLRKVHRG